MAYRYGNRTQVTLLPDSIERYVGADDPVRVYDAFINALRPEQLGLPLKDNSVGNASYDPQAMLKILVYGYSYGWRSSRKLERALHHNLSFIWISGGLKPDHKTISEFRRNNKAVLKKTLTQCARMCMKLNLIEGNTLFVDGSKFRANAGKRQTRSTETWEKYRSHIEQRITKLLEECEHTDESEKENLVSINKELRSKKKLKTKIDQLLQEIEGDKNINGTDPDCKIMKGRQGSHAGYNCQIVTDQSHGLIVSTDVTASNNDLNQLNSQIQKADEILEKASENICADAGYSSVDDIKPLIDQGKTVIVPNNQQAKRETKQAPFDKQAFRYDPQRDTYECPMGEQMRRAYQRKDSSRIDYRMQNPKACIACEHYGVCTNAKHGGRRISRLVNETTKEDLEKIYESERGQEIYEQRKMQVEHPFGHLKRNLGAGAFLLRGLSGVKAELSVLGTCFNIARMITIMGGVRPLMQKIGELN